MNKCINVRKLIGKLKVSTPNDTERQLTATLIASENTFNSAPIVSPSHQKKSKKDKNGNSVSVNTTVQLQKKLNK